MLSVSIQQSLSHSWQGLLLFPIMLQPWPRTWVLLWKIIVLDFNSWPSVKLPMFAFEHACAAADAFCHETAVFLHYCFQCLAFMSLFAESEDTAEMKVKTAECALKRGISEDKRDEKWAPLNKRCKSRCDHKRHSQWSWWGSFFLGAVWWSQPAKETKLRNNGMSEISSAGRELNKNGCCCCNEHFLFRHPALSPNPEG